MRWFLKALRRFSDYKGRSCRKEYVYFFLFYGLFLIMASVLDRAIGIGYQSRDSGYVGLFSIIYKLVMYVPLLTVSIRRSHDAGRNGWLVLVPLYLIVLLFLKSDTLINKWGEPDNYKSLYLSEKRSLIYNWWQCRSKEFRVWLYFSGLWSLIVLLCVLLFSPYGNDVFSLNGLYESDWMQMIGIIIIPPLVLFFSRVIYIKWVK